MSPLKVLYGADEDEGIRQPQTDTANRAKDKTELRGIVRDPTETVLRRYARRF